MYEHQFDITGFCNICLMHHDVVTDACYEREWLWLLRTTLCEHGRMAFENCLDCKEDIPMSETCTCDHSTIAGFHDGDCPKFLPPATPITVWVDGGCRGNGTPDASGYCSVRIRGTKPEDTMFSVDLPNAKTNNEAEYGAVICALDILKTLFDFPRDGGYNVTIHTDSQLVVYHVSGDYKKCKPKFIPSRDVIRNTITAYANNGLTVWLKWVERDIIVEKVGH